MNILYAKSVLYAYPNLESIAEQIDELVIKKALGSMTDYSPAIEQCLKIINLTEQKTVLFELDLLTEKILSKFTKDEMDCLDYKYFKRRPKEYYKEFDSSSRSYFRKQIRIAKKFAEKLEKAGFNDKAFEEKCLQIEFFVQLLKKVNEREKAIAEKAIKKPVQKSECVRILSHCAVKKTA
ncbi:MAG: hypothetical protein E7362_01420 [Clostridiales bacterium]|nr:hypothetical protein [Clostridiales bacterium]